MECLCRQQCGVLRVSGQKQLVPCKEILLSHNTHELWAVSHLHEMDVAFDVDGFIQADIWPPQSDAFIHTLGQNQIPNKSDAVHVIVVHLHILHPGLPAVCKACFWERFCRTCSMLPDSLGMLFAHKTCPRCAGKKCVVIGRKMLSFDRGPFHLVR